KLLSVDKVDLILSGYATNMVAPAVPIAMQRNMVLIGLFALAVNAQFHYPKYFSMIPTGQDPEPAFTHGFFEIAMAQSPKPETVAIVAADTEYSKNASDGARENANAAGLKIVYDKTYPPTMTDYAPVMRAVQAASPDIVVVCSYPADSVGIIRAADEIGFRPKMFGGAMVGLQSTEIKTALGPLLNGIVNYDFWLPAPELQFPGTLAFLKAYQAKAPAEGVDPLGYYLPPFAYAQAQVLEQAVAATESLDQNELAAYIRSHAFKTILGDVTFGRNGEWTQSRVLQIQFQNVQGHDLEQFRGMSKQIVLTPPAYRAGTVIYPYANARR
ncbi:MAG: amino acid ABC transporter substrate-binding protein, partial [Alphaproteobacteria bacterium]|nr:amino acid ABC transporter substrate-binding protein [Alphaproteobacteria bacterium]